MIGVLVIVIIIVIFSHGNAGYPGLEFTDERNSENQLLIGEVLDTNSVFLLCFPPSEGSLAEDDVEIVPVHGRESV